MKASKKGCIAVIVWVSIFVAGSYIDALASEQALNMKTSANCSNYVNIAAIMAERDSRVESVQHNVNKSVMVYYNNRSYISMRCSGKYMYVIKGNR